MTMTDPIADMLTRVRNANSAYHDSVRMPHSKLKTHIAEIIQQEGYIAGWSVEDGEKGKILAIDLKYGPHPHRSTAGARPARNHGPRHAPPCAASRTRACAAPRRPASCPRCAVVSASRSSPRRPAC